MDAPLDERGERAQADRPASGDDRPRRRFDLRTPHAVEAGGERVDRGGLVGRDAVGDGHVAVGRHDDALGERARIVAGVAHAVHDAVRIDDRGRHQQQITRCVALDPRAHFGHARGELVTEHEVTVGIEQEERGAAGARRVKELVGVLQRVEVTAADARRERFDEQVVVAHGRLGDLLELEPAALHRDGSHQRRPFTERDPTARASRPARR